MSVEFRNVLDGTFNNYGKMDDEQSQTGSKFEGSLSTFKKTVSIERLYPLVIGILVVLNVILIILVALVFSRTGGSNSISVTTGVGDAARSQSLKAPANGMEQRIIDKVQNNGELTKNASKSLTKQVGGVMTAMHTLMGWKRSGNLLYKLMREYVSYNRAALRCRTMEARLAAKIFRDPTAVKEMVKNQIVDHKNMNTFFWVGLNDRNVEGIWKWIDGGVTNNVTTDWWPGEPNQMGTEEDCGNIIGVTASKVLINDAPCTHGYYYMCEMEIPEDM